MCLETMSFATRKSAVSSARKYAGLCRCTVDTSAGNSFSPDVTHSLRNVVSASGSRSETTRGLSE